MMGMTPSKPDGRSLPRRFIDGVRHPRQYLNDLTGTDPVYPILILFGLNAVDELDRTVFGVLLPDIQRAFGLDFSGILTVIAIVAAISLLLQIPIAHYADRTNRVRLMLVGAVVWSIFSFGTGLAVTVWMLYVMRIGSSLGVAVNGPTQNSLIADWYGIEQRPRVYSFHRAANSVGQFIGPLFGGLLATWGIATFGANVGWRLPFFVFAFPTLIIVVLALRLRDPVRGGQERKAMGMSEEVIATEEPPPSFAEAWRMINKVASLRRIFYALPFLAAALIGFVSLASLKYESLGLDAAQRGLAAAVSEPFQLVGLYIGARIGTKLIVRDPGLIMRFLSVVAFLAAVLAGFFAFAPNVYVAVGCSIGIAVLLAIVGPGIFASLSLAIPPRARSMGFSMGSLWVLPGLIVLPMVGVIADRFGIEWGMLLMTPVFVLGGLIISSAGKTVKDDIRDVWSATAARSELLYERRQGTVKMLLVRGLNVSYGNVQILFDVDFEVDQGEIVALLGTNGAGKSTLLKAICGVVEAHAGAVIFDGRDITHAPANEIAAFGISQVPGGQGVFPTLTVKENLRVAGWIERKYRYELGDGRLPARLRNMVTRRRASMHALDERVEWVLETFPILRERLEEPAANLSGGQQQMLAIGMSFLARPKLLVIDELSLGLAPVVVEQLVEIVRAIRDQGTTIILVEQSVNVALTLAETAYFMEKGEIRFHGPTSELLDRPDVLRSVFLEGAQKGMATADAQQTEATSEVAPKADVPTVTVGAQRSAPPVDVDATPALDLQGMSVRFGGIRAVDDVSLTVAPGEIVGIIGPNGAGKTTLFDLISGFTSADAGRVVLAGRDVSRLAPDGRARRGLGRSFQDARLFPALTVEDTIAVALERWVGVRDPFNAMLRLPAQQDSERAVRARVDELIELMGIESFRSKFVRELSTGSRRVVDLACVIAHHPSVVLLDEPSSGIAQRETEALSPLLLRIRDTLDASLIVIEHDMPLITSVSDRLVALDQGHVVMTGVPDDVLNHPEVVASYLGNSQELIDRSGTQTGETST